MHSNQQEFSAQDRRDFEALMKMVVETANDFRNKMTDDYEENSKRLERGIEQSDLVFAVWQDPARQCFVGTERIKGALTMHRIGATNQLEKVRVLGIPCSGPEDAAYLVAKFGEQITRH
jgi:hypothetical protein